LAEAVKGKAVVRREIAMPKIRCLNKLRADIFPPCGKSVGVFVRLDSTELFPNLYYRAGFKSRHPVTMGE